MPWMSIANLPARQASRELLASLIDQGFDVAGLGEIPLAHESIGLGHAYGAIVTQLSDQN
jgi:hypothetical protein